MKLVSAVTCLALVASAAVAVAQPADKAAPTDKDKIPDLVYVRIATTLGDIVLELNAAKAPETVKNFLGYVQDGFYEGLMFHRVIKGFMIQGGGMNEKYEEKPTKAPIKNEATNGLQNKKYTIAMARKPDPNSATSQFFINVADNSRLDHTAPMGAGWGYTVFGKVVGGKDVVEKMANTEVKMDARADPNTPAAPTTPILIKKVEKVAEESIKDLIAAARAEE
ncbi:MAG TPA: peptidylprolyl isomerase, partial [Phycisphaerae bacterium]|nr:peptidylprolyl isomerase [Phycisphaerae bacterium]